MPNDTIPARRDVGGGSTPAHTWPWYAARIAVALIVVSVGGLLWMLHRQEQEENRTALIRDVLWVEQNVQFSLERSAEHLRQLVVDADGEVDPRRVAERVRHLLPSSAGLVEVVVLDSGGVLRAAAPAPEGTVGQPWSPPHLDAALRLARRTGKVTYGPPYAVGREHQLEVVVPCFQRGQLAGVVVGVYDLRAMLSSLVPWWLAEKQHVTIRDGSGAVLAARSNVDATDHAVLTHQVVLDPPGHGLLLHVTSYGTGTTLVRNIIALTIVALASAVLWSLWTLRRQSQRRLAAEQQLRSAHAFRKAMEDSLETGMRAVDLEGRIIYVNPAFCRMVGYSESELIGHLPPQPYWPSEDAARIETLIRSSRAENASGGPREHEYVRRSGERFDVLLYEAPLVDAMGRQTGWMGSVLDITERKRARERVRQQQEKLAATARLVTMGEMASTIAHELNQPLSAIASYSTGCRNVLATGSASPVELDDAIQKIAEQAQRAGRIIRRVHQFVRKSEPTRSRLRLHAVVDETIGFIQGEARKRRVKLRTGSLPDVELDADPVLLQQVLLNLTRNAMEAMASTPPEDRELLLDAERHGAAVTVRVVDRGCGISPEVEQQLFSPFFTTKPEGMGMGLNICRSIIEMHGGRLWAEPAPGGGTVFAFSLPLAGDAAAAVEEGAAPNQEEVA